MGKEGTWQRALPTRGPGGGGGWPSEGVRSSGGPGVPVGRDGAGRQLCVLGTRNTLRFQVFQQKGNRENPSARAGRRPGPFCLREPLGAHLPAVGADSPAPSLSADPSPHPSPFIGPYLPAPPPSSSTHPSAVPAYPPVHPSVHPVHLSTHLPTSHPSIYLPGMVTFMCQLDQATKGPSIRLNMIPGVSRQRFWLRLKLESIG